MACRIGCTVSNAALKALLLLQCLENTASVANGHIGRSVCVKEDKVGDVSGIAPAHTQLT